MPETKWSFATIREEDAAKTPNIFFEAVPTIGNHNGIVTLLLASGVPLPIEGGGGATKGVIQPIAVLRSSVAAAKALRDEIDRALLLGAAVQGGATAN